MVVNDNNTNTNTNRRCVMSPLNEEQGKEYWRRNLSLMLKLLTIWFIVSYGFGIILVDVLNQIKIGGYQLGFWFAQQGSIYVFVGLIFYYAKRMAALDKEFSVEEDE
jgi:putative solute:sodium symporter small subunit